jgi:hypothetical protein
VLWTKTEEATEVWNLKVLRIGQRACYVFRKYQFNTDYRKRSFRITSLVFLITFFLQTNEEDLFHTGPSPITSTAQKIHYSLSPYTTWFETVSILSHGTLILCIYLWFYKNYTIKKFEILLSTYYITWISCSRFQLARSLRRGSEAARLFRMWVRNPPGAWMFESSECCVLSDNGQRDELINRPELESTMRDMHQVRGNQKHIQNF